MSDAEPAGDPPASEEPAAKPTPPWRVAAPDPRPAPAGPLPDPGPFQAADLWRVLVGDADAIRRAAADPRAVWIAGLLVLSAALGREYDGEYLLAEPWHLAISPGASFLVAFVIYLGVRSVGPWSGGPWPRLLPGFRQFLTLFWLTAPLAWVYAVPYERLLSPEAAVTLNLSSLGLVAAWRVVLTVRVVNVLFGAPLLQAIAPVLLVSDVLALFALQMLPFPIITIMGGVRLAPHEQVLQSIALTILLSGLLTLPVWGLGWLVLASAKLAARWRGTLPAPRASAEVPARPWPRGPLGAAVGALAVGLALLPFAQPEQRLRWQVQAALGEGRPHDAIGLLAQHPRAAFPPQWVPSLPRSYGYTQLGPLLTLLDAAVADARTPEWALLHWEEQLGRHIDLRRGFRFQEPERSRVLRLLLRLPRGVALASEHTGAIAGLVRRAHEDPDLDRVALRELLARLEAAEER